MQVSVQQLSPVLVELSIEVPSDRVKVEVDRAYVVLQKSARVRGFRPGKAPRDVLQHLFADRVAYDVTQRLVDETLNVAISERSIQPLSQPAIEPQKVEVGKTFLYKARFEVKPEVEKVEWHGFDLEKPSVDVRDEMVSTELEALRKVHAELAVPEPARAAKTGDVVTIEFTLDVDGKAVSKTAESVTTELGSGQLLADIDAALVGASAGDKKDVELTFPETFGRDDMRGKKGVFHVEVKELKERVLPALDDEFAKDVGSFDDLKALEADVRAKLGKALEQRAEDAIAEQIVAKLCEKNPIPCPPTLVEQQCRMMENELVQQARRSGRQLQHGEELHARVHADAEIKVRAGLLMAEIARLEQVKVTDEDIEKGLAELAAQVGKDVARVRAEYRDKQRRDILIGMILEDKILDIIEAKANIKTAS